MLHCTIRSGRFLAQHSVAMLEQCWNYSNQCRNNVAMLCCAKNCCCELACKQLLHLRESREVMREQHAKRDVSVRGGFSDSRFASRAINGELASRLVENPGGTLHIKGVGMLVGNFELNP